VHDLTSCPSTNQNGRRGASFTPARARGCSGGPAAAGARRGVRRSPRRSRAAAWRSGGRASAGRRRRAWRGMGCSGSRGSHRHHRRVRSANTGGGPVSGAGLLDAWFRDPVRSGDGGAENRQRRLERRGLTLRASVALGSRRGSGCGAWSVGDEGVKRLVRRDRWRCGSSSWQHGANGSGPKRQVAGSGAFDAQLLGSTRPGSSRDDSTATIAVQSSLDGWRSGFGAESPARPGQPVRGTRPETPADDDGRAAVPVTFAPSLPSTTPRRPQAPAPDAEASARTLRRYVRYGGWRRVDQSVCPRERRIR
jgi:hypothetical protein